MRPGRPGAKQIREQKKLMPGGKGSGAELLLPRRNPSLVVQPASAPFTPKQPEADIILPGSNAERASGSLRRPTVAESTHTWA